MEATIDGEDGEYLKIYVTDNNNNEHNITIEIASGEIAYHEQDGYPDKAAERTPVEDEHVNQARRYAKYHVAQKTKHDVLPFEHDQAAMDRVKQAIETLSAEDFQDHFGTYFNQINGRLPGVEPPVPEPDAIEDDDFRLYLLDVYLDDRDQIEAVSGIHFLYLADDRERQYQFGDKPFNRDPDAQLQLPPNYLPSLEAAQDFFAYHLDCQIRDCHLLRGEEPPEAYRVLGPGLYDGTTRYLREERPYHSYHAFHADVPDYTLDYDYGFGEKGKEMAKIATAVAERK
ncbi:hypothetical protein [Halomicrobium katesii]|uniref:hypothetical protein n=1 Tax=Halomicrobium katesii TaxID=437163 RepID=UPI000373714E|nr:hypothetical protein [Halomicrobium katesii]